MAVLEPGEYDISYFDGEETTYSHNAGYADYHKWYRINDDFVPHAESTGEYWHDMAKMLVTRYNLNPNYKVLEIGCAKGYVVEALRDEGIDAWGIDVSDYAISCAREDIKPYLRVGDIRTALKDYKRNEFDVLFSRWTLECIDDTDLPELIADMNRISKLQIHAIDESIKPEYYNRKLITEWQAMDFKTGTILTNNSHFKNLITK